MNNETFESHYCGSSHRITNCHSDDDGYCDWNDCPQLKDNEPENFGRGCPLHCWDDSEVC